MSDNQRTRKNAIALLAAVALFLSSIEYLIPKPVPFLKIGLANLPILIGLAVLQPRELFSLVAVKIIGQGIVQGTLFSYIIIFSAAGSLTSAIIMMLLHRLLHKHISLIGISVIGALVSNIAQITIARFLLFGQNAWLIAPAFLIAGIASAVMLGLFAENFIQRSHWLRQLPIKKHKLS